MHHRPFWRLLDVLSIGFLWLGREVASYLLWAVCGAAVLLAGAIIIRFPLHSSVFINLSAVIGFSAMAYSFLGRQPARMNRRIEPTPASLRMKDSYARENDRELRYLRNQALRSLRELATSPKKERELADLLMSLEVVLLNMRTIYASLKHLRYGERSDSLVSDDALRDIDNSLNEIERRINSLLGLLYRG